MGVRVVPRLLQARMQYAAKLGRSVSIEEVANGTGIDRDTVARYEQGKTRRYDADFLARFCAFYGVGISDILEYVGDETQKNGAARLEPQFA